MRFVKGFGELVFDIRDRYFFEVVSDLVRLKMAPIHPMLRRSAAQHAHSRPDWLFAHLHHSVSAVAGHLGTPISAIDSQPAS